jgi:hypothetical protein
LSLSVVYALRRDEVWRWYKVAWKHRLWPFHAFMLVMPIGLFLALRHDGDWLNAVVSGGIIGLIACVFMVVYPQIRYRPEERTLTVDDAGVRGVRGKSDYFVKWEKIARVEDDGDSLVISERKLNAFIVPHRAFASNADRAAFRDFVAARIES